MDAMRSRTPGLDAPPLVRYGFPDWQSHTSPAAGAQFSIATDGRYWSRFVSIRCRLVTSATVANREVVVEYNDPEGNNYHTCGAPVTVAASTTIDFCFSSFLDEAAWPVNSMILVPLAPIILPATFVMRLFVVNIDTTDALSRIRTVRERFFSDSPL